MPRTRAGAKPTGVRRGARVIAYCRVSAVGERGEALMSPDIQMDQITRFCEREGLHIVAQHLDLNLSGKSSTKRKIAAMVESVGAKEADGIVVWKYSRWGRNVLDSMLNIAELEQAGGFIASATEGASDMETPAGKMNLNLMLVIAQWFSDQQGEVWKNVHTYRTETLGVPHSGSARFGYTVVDKRYEIDPLTGPVLAEAYHRVLAGEKVAALVRDFTARGIRTTRGNNFVDYTLRWALDSGFGAGLLPQGKKADKTWLPGTHQGVIDESTWQRYLATRGERPSAQWAKGGRPLSGLVWCTGCDTAMLMTQSATKVGGRGGTNVTYRRFVCRSRRAHLYSTPPTCPAPAHIKESDATALVRSWLGKVAASQGEFDAQWKDAAHPARSRSVADIAKDIERVERRRGLLLAKLLDGDVAQDVYAATEASLVTQRDDLEQARVGAVRNDAVAALPKVDVATALLAGWEAVEGAELNRALATVLARVEVAANPAKPRSPIAVVLPAWSV